MRARLWTVLASAGLLAVGASSAQAQHRLFGGGHQDCPPAPAPMPAQTLPMPKEQGQAPKPADKPAAPVPPVAPVEPMLGDERFGAVASETVALATPNMLGDFIGGSGCSTSLFSGSSSGRPGPGGPQGGASLNRCDRLPVASRSFKISDNESPRPADRVYFSYNYFNNAYQSVNQRVAGFGPAINVSAVSRETIGVEKLCFCDGLSLGLRLPVTSTRVDSPFIGLNGSETDIGDLALIAKYALMDDVDAGRLCSVGLAVTLPTGPDSFDPNNRETYHSSGFQPFGGVIQMCGDFFIHGFSAIDIPTDDRDALLLFNDIGVGCMLYTGCETGVTAIIPTFEVHVTTPLSHKDAFDVNDPSGISDAIVLTSGVTFELCRKATVAVGVATPVTGPRPFDYEFQLQFNYHFDGLFGGRFDPSPRIGMY